MLASDINPMPQAEQHRRSFHLYPPPRRAASHLNRSAWIAPWTSLSPWWAMLAGVVLGQWIGTTPALLIAIAVACLLLSILMDDRPES
jgi:hypothetical protein